MFLDPTDTNNKYYICGVEVNKRIAEKDASYKIARAEWKESIRLDGVAADEASRSYRHPKNVSETNRQIGMLFSN